MEVIKETIKIPVKVREILKYALRHTTTINTTDLFGRKYNMLLRELHFILE
jgi:hypothetical protein